LKRNLGILVGIAAILLLVSVVCSSRNTAQCQEKYGPEVSYGLNRRGFAMCVDVDGNPVGTP
jgi:hypothetical protein